VSSYSRDRVPHIILCGRALPSNWQGAHAHRSKTVHTSETHVCTARPLHLLKLVPLVTARSNRAAKLKFENRRCGCSQQSSQHTGLQVASTQVGISKQSPRKHFGRQVGALRNGQGTSPIGSMNSIRECMGYGQPTKSVI
jgi:hypothetical protein